MGDEYLIGYRLAIQNATLITDRITVSKSMTSCLGEKTETLYLPRDSNQTLHTLLKIHEDDFIEFASQQSINLQSRQNISNYTHNSTDSMTLPTRCYVVDFNDDSVTISLLK
jgi:DNA-dependent RNA polymerase auxiliary subunit epsilon